MSKKVKGQKLDLATFVGPSNPTLNLPTAPDPQRQRNIRKTDDTKVERVRDSQGWSRNVRSDESFGNKSSEDETVWRKSYGLKTSGGESSERPRLNILPKSTGGSSATESDIQDDKWSKVFKNVPDSKGKSAGRFDDDTQRGGKFSTPNYKRSSREEISSLALPTAPRSVVSNPAPAPVKPVVVAVKDTSVNDLKAAKAVQKQEATRKAKELRELQIQESLNAATLAVELSSKAYQAGLVDLSTGLKGDMLVDHIKSSDSVVTGSMLLKGVLEQTENEMSQWWIKSNYGAALAFLLQSSFDDQVSALYVIQEFCHSKKFPKVEVKGVTRKLIEYYFGLMLSNEFVDAESFIAWADDSSARSDTSLGRLDAIVQTTNFVQSIRHAMMATEDDPDDDEVDAPREILK